MINEKDELITKLVNKIINIEKPKTQEEFYSLGFLICNQVSYCIAMNECEKRSDNEVQNE